MSNTDRLSTALFALVVGLVLAWIFACVVPTENPPTTYSTDASGFGAITNGAGRVTLTDRYGEMDR